MKPKPIHAVSQKGYAHPFKALTKCGKMVLLGKLGIPNERPVTCKICIKKVAKEIEKMPPIGFCEGDL